MFDIRDHGGHFKGGSGNDDTKSINLKTVASIRNTNSEYFFTRSVTLVKILRSNNEKDIFVFLSNDEVLKYDSVTGEFGYYCKLNELQNLNPYMHRKYTVHKMYNNTLFLRLNDNIILIRYGNNILVYDTNYNLLTTQTLSWYSTQYGTYSWFLSVTPEGESVVVINGYNSSTGAFDVPWILSNEGYTLTRAVGATSGQYFPIMNTNYMYYGNTVTVSIFDFEEREYVVTNVSLNNGSNDMPIQYIPGHLYAQYHSASGSYSTYFYKFLNNTIVNDASNTKSLSSIVAMTGLITDPITQSGVWVRSNLLKKFFTSSNEKPIPYIELRQNSSNEIWLTKFDRNNNGTTIRKVADLAFSDTGVYGHMRPDDAFINNMSNGNRFLQMYVSRASSTNYIREIHVIDVTLNISI